MKSLGKSSGVSSEEKFLDKYRGWEQKARDDPGWGDENPFHFEINKRKLARLI